MYKPRDTTKYITQCPQTNRKLDHGNIGEHQTIQYIYEHLDTTKVGSYHILVNYHLPLRGANTLEIDLLVITTFGIFIIEVKNWRGSIEAFDDYWLTNKTWRRGNVFGSISIKAKQLHSYLKEHVKNLSVKAGNVNISPLVVIVPGLRQFKNSSSFDSKAVSGLDQSLIQALSSSDLLRYDKCPRLTNADIETLRQSLFRQHQPTQYDVVNHYHILRKVRDADLFEELEAQNMHINQQIVRLKCYQLSQLTDEKINDQTIMQFKRNAEVVSSLSEHESIVKTRDFFPDPKHYEYFYEVTDYIHGQRFDELLHQQHQKKLAFSFQEQVAMLKTICSALQHAHNHCDDNGHPTPAYHRNLCLETVFLTQHPRTKASLIKLADFDFAKFGPHTINPMHSNSPASRRNRLIQKVFTAPEVIHNASDASAQSDIYSLGIFWYFLALLPKFDANLQFNPQTDTTQLLSLRLPHAARELIMNMLAYNPEHRPHTIEEVYVALASLA